MYKKTILFTLLFTLCLSLILILDLTHYLTPHYLQSKQALLIRYQDNHPWLSMLFFALTYVLFTILSVPGAAVILSLLGGALFGLILGSILVSFSSTLGATITFLVSRYFFYPSLQKKFGKQLKKINHEIKKEGAFYLFSLRLTPIFPFVLINLLMGITPIKLRTFYWVSQIGMLPATIIYVNAGLQIINYQTHYQIISFKLFIALVLLGIFPLLVKKTLNLYKKYKDKSYSNKK